MEIVTIAVGQVNEFYFYMHYPIKALLFEKIINWTSLSFSYSIKITYILLRQVISLKKIIEIYYFNLLVTYLYSFNPFISINENGKYLSRNII